MGSAERMNNLFPLHIGFLLTLNANRYPQKTAIVCNRQRISYAQLNRRVNKLAHGLLELGVTKGDKVAYLLPNGLRIVELYYAVQKIGAVSVAINYRLASPEIGCLLEQADCQVFVYHELFDDKVRQVKENVKTISLMIRVGEQPIQGEYAFEALTDHDHEEEPDILIGEEDLCRIQFTGGTTGRSKGVMRTQRQEIFQVIGITTALELGGPDRVMLTQSPLCHQAGLSWLNVAIGAGNTLIVCDRFEPEKILRQIQEESVTNVMLLPPSSYHRIFALPSLAEYDLSSVKSVHSSAGGTSPEIVRKLYKVFPNCVVRCGYGLTETGGVGTTFVLTREVLENNPELTKSVGKEMSFLELRLVDESGREVPVGETGECIARGPSVMTGYYNQPELTEEVIKEGWVYTGDLLRKDEKGYYYFMDRKKDMIKSGGENVFAQEVEGVIRTHSAVDDCAVIGVPDPRFGEAVMAVIKTKPGQAVTGEGIQEHCKKYLAGYKKPRLVEFVDEFPVDQAGKIQKYKLRATFARKDFPETM